MATPPLEDLKRHVLDLATAFKVELVEDPARHPLHADARFIAANTIHVGTQIIPVTGAPERRVVTMHPIEDEGFYAIALHELGHLIAPNGMVPTGLKLAAPSLESIARLMLHEEESAWDWARHYALVWTELMTSIRNFAVMTYVQHVEKGRRLDEAGVLLGLNVAEMRKEILAKLRGK